MARLLLALILLLIAAPAAAAAPPPNDAQDAATALVPPTGVDGTTAESTLEPGVEPQVHGAEVSGDVWYAFRTSTARRVVVRLRAQGDLDAGLAVYRRARSQLPLEHAVVTGEDGRASIFFDSRAGARYVVRVAQRANSVAGSFHLDVDLPRLFPPAPGTPLPRGGATGTVDGLANAADAYSAVLKAGVTYRVNLANLSRNRLVLRVFGPGTTSFRDDAPLRQGRSYLLLTPSPETAGRYSFVVSASRVETRQGYRLRIGRAGRDDRFPGLPLPDRRPVRGALDARGIDAVDVYRFDVLHRSTVRLGVTAGYDVDLNLRTQGGRRVDQGSSDLVATLRPGRYVVQLRAHGTARGAYRLRRVTRTFTRLRLGAGGTVAPGQAVSLPLRLDPGESGPVRVTIERFDPFQGWLFATRLRTRVSGGTGVAVYRPPSIGRYRARAEFLGTRSAEPSRSAGFARFRVVAALTG